MGSLTLTVQETVPVTNYEKSHFTIHHRLLPLFPTAFNQFINLDTFNGNYNGSGGHRK